MYALQAELAIRACAWYDAEDLSRRKFDTPAWESLRGAVVGDTWSGSWLATGGAVLSCLCDDTFIDDIP